VKVGIRGNGGKVPICKIARGGISEFNELVSLRRGVRRSDSEADDHIILAIVQEQVLYVIVCFLVRVDLELVCIDGETACSIDCDDISQGKWVRTNHGSDFILLGMIEGHLANETVRKRENVSPLLEARRGIEFCQKWRRRTVSTRYRGVVRLTAHILKVVDVHVEGE